LWGDVSIGYSGGLDSSSVAWLVAREKRWKVHLHTLDHGHGYLFKGWTLRSLRTLLRATGDGWVTHRNVSTKELFGRVAWNSLLADLRRYGQSFGCCLGCTMAFISEMVRYNLVHGIPHIMFGSSVGGEYAVMSMPATRAFMVEFCGRYGIDYVAPLLADHIVKQDERTLLDEAGIFRGLRVKNKRSIGNQGYCLLSVQHLPDVLFDVHPTYDVGAVTRFLHDREELCHAWIREQFARSGEDLEAARERLLRLSEKGP